MFDEEINRNGREPDAIHSDNGRMAPKSMQRLPMLPLPPQPRMQRP
jgi:hypothetical protein